MSSSPTDRAALKAEKDACVERLKANAFTQKDYARYVETKHWKAKFREAVEFWTDFCGGRFLCLFCERRAAQLHHTRSGYRHLFREDVRLHLRPLCKRCHRRLSRG